MSIWCLEPIIFFKFAELFYEMENRDSQLIDIWEGTDKIVEELPTERNYSLSPV